MHPLLYTLLLLGLSPVASAAVFRVGSDAACTHHSLYDAITAAESNGPEMDEIRIALNHDQRKSSGKLFIIDQSLRIVGGYKNCGSLGVTGRTQLAGYPNGHFTIASQPGRRSFVELNDLELYGGNGAIAGGSLEVYGRAEVSLNNSVLRDNWGESGGAIYVDGLQFADPARVSLSASEVSRNRSSYAGGGIDCHGGAQIVLKRGSTIRDNEAIRGVGGGAALDGCLWWQGGGTSVARNKAGYGGGGIAAHSGSYLFATWAAEGGVPSAPSIDHNETAEYGGGGIALWGAGTYLDARGLDLINNVSISRIANFGNANGAALLMSQGATAWLHRDELCKAGNSACSRVAGNLASVEAGFANIIFVTTGAFATISQTEVSNNSSIVANRPGSSLLSVHDEDKQSRIRLSNARLTGNTASELFHSTHADERAYEIVLSTLKDNRVEILFDSQLRDGPITVQMLASVVDESAPFALGALAADSTLDCVLSRVAPNGSATRSLVADPRLSADGKPLAGSSAIDFCSAGTLPLHETDFLGRPRPLNDWELPDRYGPVDVGAIEVIPPVIVVGP